MKDRRHRVTTKHPGSKVPTRLRVERRRKANKTAKGSRRTNR